MGTAFQKKCIFTEYARFKITTYFLLTSEQRITSQMNVFTVQNAMWQIYIKLMVFFPSNISYLNMITIPPHPY